MRKALKTMLYFNMLLAAHVYKDGVHEIDIPAQLRQKGYIRRDMERFKREMKIN